MRYEDTICMGLPCIDSKCVLNSYDKNPLFTTHVSYSIASNCKKSKACRMWGRRWSMQQPGAYLQAKVN